MLKPRSLIAAQIHRSQLVTRQFCVFSIGRRYFPALPFANANFCLQRAQKSTVLRLDPEIIDQKPVSWKNQFERTPKLSDQIKLLQELRPIASTSGRTETLAVIRKHFEKHVHCMVSIRALLAHFEAVSVMNCDNVIQFAVAEILLKAIIRTKENLSFDDLRSCLHYARTMKLFVSTVDCLHSWMFTEIQRHLSDATIPSAQLEHAITDAFVIGIKPATDRETAHLLSLVTDSEQLVQNLRSDDSELPFLRALSFGSIDFNHLNEESRAKVLKVAESFFSKETASDENPTFTAESFVTATRCLSFIHARLTQHREGEKLLELIRSKLSSTISWTPEKILPQFLEALYRIGFGLPEIFSRTAKTCPNIVYGTSDMLYKSFNAVSQMEARQRQPDHAHDKTPFTTFLLRLIERHVPLDNSEHEKIELCQKQPEEIAIFLHLTMLLLARENGVSFLNFENNDKKRVLLAAQRSYRHIDSNRFADLLWSLHYMKVTFEIMEKSRLADDFFLTIEKRADTLTPAALHKLARYLVQAGFSWRTFDEKWEKSLFHAIITCINPADNVNSQLELLSGLSDLTFRWNQLPAKIRGLLPWIGEKTDQWNPRTHMTLVWALGRLKCSSCEVDPAIMRLIKQKMAEYPMQSANGFLLLYTNLSRMDVSWQEIPQAQMMAEFIDIKDFNPSNISQIVYILSKMHSRWNDFSDDFKQILVKRLQSSIGRFTESDVASAMQSVSYLAFDAVHNIERDQHLMTMIKTLVQRLQKKKAEKFKLFADRQRAQIFFEFLATFPAGQLMIAQLYGKRLEEKFVPLIDANPFADDGTARKKGLSNHIEVTLEMGNVISTLLQGTGYGIRADFRPVRGVFGQELTIFSRANKQQPLALVSLHCAPTEDRDCMERLEQFRRHFYHFHLPNAKVFVIATNGLGLQELKAEAESLTAEILRAVEGKN